VANAILSERAYTPLASLERALYVAYEAKRLSEWCDGVGKGSQIMLHAHLHAGASPDAGIVGNYLSEEALQHLESLRKEFFLQPIANIDPFPHRFFSGRYPFKS
jgi:hypothetical protein